MPTSNPRPSGGGTASATPSMRSIGSGSNISAMQQPPSAGPALQTSQPTQQQQQSQSQSAQPKSSHSTKAASQPFHSVAQGPWVPPSLHVCPGPETEDEFDGESGGAAASDGEMTEESDLDAGASDADDDFLSPPLIPPFRFATVETARPVLVREAAPPLRNVKSIASLSSAASVNSASAAISSPVPLPLPLPLQPLAVGSVSSGQSTPNSAAATPPLIVSTPGRGERRVSLNGTAMANWGLAAAAMTTATAMHSTAASLAGAGGGGGAAAGPAASAPQSSGTSTPRQMLPAAALASANVAASAGAPVQLVPSPPTSPSRAHSLTNVTASTSAATLSAAAAASASHTGRHVCLRGLPDHSLYRGAYPTLKNFHFLSRLRLRSIVSLTPEPPTADLRLFCREGGGTSSHPADPTPVRLFHFSVAQYAENVALTHAQAVAIVQVLIDADNLPALVHCVDGCNNTSIVMACLRKVQGWTMAPIWGEMLRFTRESSGILDAERDFVLRFNHHGLVAPPVQMTSKELLHGAAAGGTAAAATAAAAAKAASALSTPNNLLIRVPASLPSWLWGGLHLASHPLGLKLYDAHVPAFLALHSKLLAPLDPATIAAAAAAATAAASSSGGGRGTPAPAAVSAAATVLASHAGWLLLPEDTTARALWDGIHLHDPLPAGGETEKERRKREKKEAKARGASSADQLQEREKDAREKGVEEAVESVREKDKRTVGAAEGEARNQQNPQCAPAADADAIVGALGAAAKAKSKTKGKDGADSGKDDAGADSTKKKKKDGASTESSGAASGSVVPSAAAAAAPAATAAAAAAVVAAMSPPLSHPGEFHSLVDLDKSHWGRERSSLAADMLFPSGSFGLPLGGADEAPTRGREPWLVLAPEEQFVEHPEDPDEQFTRDEFDGDVSLLLASLALEGFTMNHKITRPMQLFHADQGQA